MINDNSQVLNFYNKDNIFSINELVKASANSAEVPSVGNSSFIGENHILNINKKTNTDIYDFTGNNNKRSSIYVLANENGYCTILKGATVKDNEETVSYHLMNGVILNIENLSKTEIQEEFSSRVIESMILRNMPDQNQERIVINTQNGKTHSYEGLIADVLDKNGLTPQVINVNNHKKQSNLRI